MRRHCATSFALGLIASVAPLQTRSQAAVLSGIQALPSFGVLSRSQSPQDQSIPPDSPSWELRGQAKATEYQGRSCLYIDGGTATLRDLELRDAVIDVDVATPAKRGFFG